MHESLEKSRQLPTEISEQSASSLNSRQLLSIMRRKADVETTVGINLQPGQRVLITAETCHAEYVNTLVESLKAHGAGEIDFDWLNQKERREKVLNATEEELRTPDARVEKMYEHWFLEKGARISITGEEDPDFFKGVPEKRMALLQQATRLERRLYYQEAAGKNATQWLVTSSVTPGWARKVLPGLPGDEAVSKLWSAVATAMRLDAPDPVRAWDGHFETLQKRSKMLNGLGIDKLHFTGPGTDLTVSLSRFAEFRGGRAKTRSGIQFVANLPTEEVFTSPDCRFTEGMVRITRPVKINGVTVKGLELEFKGGKLVSFDAAENRDAFAAHIETDEAALRLGEVALVGIDSRVYQTGLVFDNILFDENAACHIAIGSGSPKCLRGGVEMTPEELRKQGCNKSATGLHTDLMISNDKVDVTAILRDGSDYPLLRDGEWVKG